MTAFLCHGRSNFVRNFVVLRAAQKNENRRVVTGDPVIRYEDPISKCHQSQPVGLKSR